MDTLLFIRHAGTGLCGRFVGHSDPPVDAQGRGQIERLVRALEGTSVDAVYTSDLERARVTAEAVAGARGLRPVALPALREIAFGAWEGLSWAEIEGRDPEYARRWVEGFPELPAPGGERHDDLRSRVLAAVGRILAAPGGCAAVVTHAGVMRVVLACAGVGADEAWERTREYCCLLRLGRGSELSPEPLLQPRPAAPGARPEVAWGRPGPVRPPRITMEKSCSLEGER